MNWDAARQSSPMVRRLGGQMWRWSHLTAVMLGATGLVTCGGVSTEEDPMPKIVGPQSLANTLITGSQNPVNGLQVSLQNPDGNPESGTMTLAFAVHLPPLIKANPAPPPPTVTSLEIIFPQAIISWTISSNRVTRRISVGNGVTITGVGEAVTVQLKDVTPPDISYTLGFSYGVDVQVGLGPRGSTAQLPTLQEPATSGLVILGGTNTTFPIPLDAGVIAVQVLVASDTVIPGVPVDAVVTLLNPLNQLTRYNPDVQTGMVPVPPSATEIVISNLDPVNAIFATIVWGIDG